MMLRSLLVLGGLWLGTAPPLASQEWAWVTSDTHVHLTGCHGAALSLDEALQLMQVSATQVAHVLIWGGCTTVAGQPSCSLEHSADLHIGQPLQPLSDPDTGYVLHVDYELSALPGHKQSHQILLNLGQVKPVTSEAVTYPGTEWVLPNFVWAQPQGALVGTSHGQAWGVEQFDVADHAMPHPRELPIDAMLARLDFLEANRVGTDEYRWILYQLWNAGLHVTPVGGSDYPCRDFGYGLGRVQTVVAVPAGETLDYPAYLDGIRDGRTFIRNNHPGVAPDVLDLRVGGRVLGSEIVVPGGQPTIEVVLSGVSAVPDRPVELVVDGEVVITETLTAEPASFSYSLPVDESFWIAARTADAHTAATFVLVDGCPIRNDPESAYLWASYVEAWYDQESALGHFGDSLPEVYEARALAKRLWIQTAIQGEPWGRCAANQVPVVDAGADRLLDAPGSLVLAGSVDDDGLPDIGMARTMWIKRRGPGFVTFGNPTRASTTAHFSEPGRYVLQLRHYDGALEVRDEMIVQVGRVAEGAVGAQPGG